MHPWCWVDTEKNSFIHVLILLWILLEISTNLESWVYPATQFILSMGPKPSSSPKQGYVVAVQSLKSHRIPCDPMGLQHPPGFPLLHNSLEFYSNLYPLMSQWCLPTIKSSVVPFSSCLQFFPSIWVLSNELVLCISWPLYWTGFSINTLQEYSGSWFLTRLIGLISHKDLLSTAVPKH